MSEPRLSGYTIVEGRVELHPENPTAFRVASENRWYPLAKNYAGPLPKQGQFVRLLISPAGVIHGIRIRGPIADRLVRQHEQEVYGGPL